MTVYLTPEQALYIHYRLIHETGGETGLRDPAALRSALKAPQEIMDGREVYAGLYKKCAVLLQSALKNRPFTDGNNRAAIAIVDLFLRINGHRLGSDTAELVRFVGKCARSQPSLEFMTAWFWQYSRPLQPGRN